MQKNKRSGCGVGVGVCVRAVSMSVSGLCLSRPDRAASAKGRGESTEYYSVLSPYLTEHRIEGGDREQRPPRPAGRSGDGMGRASRILR